MLTLTITGEIAPVTVNVYTNGTVFNAFTVTGAISPVIVNVYTNGSVYTNKCYNASAIVRPTMVYLLDIFCFSIHFYLLLSPYLCLISFLYLDLYVLEENALVS